MGFDPLPVASAGYVADPLLMLQVPLDCLANSTLKGFRRTPAEFALDPGCIHGITPVVSGTILHKCDQAAARLSAASGHLIYDVADCPNDIDILLLVPAADVVSLPHFSAREHGCDGLAVIFHVEPVANVPSVSVDRCPLAIARVEDDQRNEFLRKLNAPVVSRAIRRQR